MQRDRNMRSFMFRIRSENLNILRNSLLKTSFSSWHSKYQRYPEKMWVSNSSMWLVMCSYGDDSPAWKLESYSILLVNWVVSGYWQRKQTCNWNRVRSGQAPIWSLFSPWGEFTRGGVVVGFSDRCMTRLVSAASVSNSPLSVASTLLAASLSGYRFRDPLLASLSGYQFRGPLLASQDAFESWNARKLSGYALWQNSCL